MNQGTIFSHTLLGKGQGADERGGWEWGKPWMRVLCLYMTRFVLVTIDFNQPLLSRCIKWPKHHERENTDILCRIRSLNLKSFYVPEINSLISSPDGKNYAVGEKWHTRNDVCTQCACVGFGEVQCEAVMCPPLTISGILRLFLLIIPLSYTGKFLLYMKFFKFIIV